MKPLLAIHILAVFCCLALAAPASALVINEVHYDPAPDVSGDANGDGVRGGSADEFVELVNETALALDLGDWTIQDAVGVRHTFPTGTELGPNCAIVVFGGGSPTGLFGGSLVQTASTGFLGLNNAGDAVTVRDAADNEVATLTYDGTDAQDQSLTRDPDLTGGFVAHSTATSAGGSLFSPGVTSGGSDFPCQPVAIEREGWGLLKSRFEQN